MRRGPLAVALALSIVVFVWGLCVWPRHVGGRGGHGPRLTRLRNKTDVELAVVVPLVEREAQAVVALWAAWAQYPPCQQPRWVPLVLYLDTNWERAAGLARALSLYWRHSVAVAVRRCFSLDSPVLRGADLAPGTTHPAGPCLAFYAMFERLHLTTPYILVSETDVRPIRPLWLDRVIADIPHTRSFQQRLNGEACTFWMRGSVTRSDPSVGELGLRRDLHLNGNALYCLHSRGFAAFRRDVQAAYPASDSVRAPGCDARDPYAVGHDHAMWRFREHLVGVDFARAQRLSAKFGHWDVLQNRWHEPYDTDAVLTESPDTWLVHSKWPTLSPFDQKLRLLWRRLFQRDANRFERLAVLSRVRSGEWDLASLMQHVCLAYPHHHLCLNKSLDNDGDGVYVWSSDFHPGPGVCAAPLLRAAGGVLHAEVDFPLCEHHGVCRDRLKVLAFDEWRGFGLEPCPHRLRRRFYDAYRDDPEFDRVDAFMCSHPLANCELYMPFGRPLLLYATTRLEFGRLDDNIDWRRPFLHPQSPLRWTEWLHNLHKILSRPGSRLLANNAYDAQYLLYFTGRRATILPSGCDDVADPASSGTMGPVWLPVRPEILLGPSRDGFETGDCAWYNCDAWSHPILLELKTSAAAVGLRFRRVRELYPRYEPVDLLSHPAMVIMPYQASVMSAFEAYRLGIPLFAPSPRLLLEWHRRHRYLSERVYGHPPQLQHLLHPDGRDEALAMPDPNSDDPSDVEWWIRWFDVYQWPHIRLFDTWHELCQALVVLTQDDRGWQSLLRSTMDMRQHSADVASRSLLVWQDIVRDVRASRQRRVPQNETIDGRLRRLYGPDVWPVATDGSCLTHHPDSGRLFSEPILSQSLYLALILPWLGVIVLAAIVGFVRVRRR